MDISVHDQNSIRVGGDWPIVVDISEGSDFIATAAYWYDGESGRIELREKNGHYCLLVVRYADTKLPDLWQDARVVWRFPAAENAK